jgi:competence protein ComEC
MGLVIGQDRLRSLDGTLTTDGERPTPDPTDTKLRVLKAWLYKKGKLYLLFTLSASLSTAPLVAFYFQQVSWVGLFSNGVIVPWVGVVMVPLGLMSAGLSLFSPSGFLPMAGLNDFVVVSLLRLVAAFASFPWAEIHIASPTFLVMILLYAVLFPLLLWGTRPGKWGLIAVVTILCLVLWKPGIQASGGESAVRVTYLDVGQGDSAVVQSEGKVMVIDGGGTFSDSFDIGRSVVAPYLWNQGIRRIDTLVATHPQLDHMEGLLYLIDHFPVGEAWTNGDPGEGSLGKAFDRRMHLKEIPSRVIFMKAGEGVFGDCRVDFLNPPVGGSDGRRIGVNDRSIVFQIRCDRVSFLFTGDIERAGIQNLLTQGKSLDNTVLKVPHHGGRSSVNEEFVSRVCPQAAVFSSGYKNRFHHPTPEALSAYQKVGAKIFRTDVSGALVVDWDGKNLRFRTGSDISLRPVKRRHLMNMWSEELGNYKRAFRE